MAGYVWAPWIDYNGGTWYIYFSAGSSSDNFAQRIYVISNSSANPTTGTWTERGQIIMNWDSFTLDPTTFVCNNTRYLVWAQKYPAITGNSNIYIAALNGPLAISGTRIRISKPDYSWEKVTYWVNEAPAVLQKNGKVFITYSASATDSNYCMGMLTASASSNLLNASSWSKSATPVFQSSDATSQYGPGSNCFTTSPDGSDDLLVYNARNYKNISGDPLFDPNRNTRVQQINWNSDGTPNFGIPVADGTITIGGSTTPTPTPTSTATPTPTPTGGYQFSLK